jgi:hypothetical protein
VRPTKENFEQIADDLIKRFPNRWGEDAGLSRGGVLEFVGDALSDFKVRDVHFVEKENDELHEGWMSITFDCSGVWSRGFFFGWATMEAWQPMESSLTVFNDRQIIVLMKWD